jgi:hypothetical protein
MRVERTARFGGEGVQETSEALTALERRRLAGEQVTDAEVRNAEKRLADARASSHEPWPGRTTAERLAVRDADQQVGTLITERFDELLAGLHEEAHAVADRANHALAEVIAAYQARETVAARIDAPAGTIGCPRLGMSPSAAWSPSFARRPR